MFDERLIVVGTGIRVVGQLTIETISWIQRAECIFHIVEDTLAASVLSNLNPFARQSTLTHLYEENKLRAETYEAMVQTIMQSVRESMLTVCVLYGHPGVMAYPGHEAIRRSRLEGFKARMLPAISAEDCLFADLEIDPATNGCQTYEATDVMWKDRRVDPTSHLVLWQIGAVGDLTFHKGNYNLLALPLLVEKLYQWYPRDHRVTVYEAAIMLGCEPLIQTMPLSELTAETVTARSTLSIPPIQTAKTDDIVYERYKSLSSSKA
jgi:uncharacterized protein YabN with tetrapyrrole methylase and pyrophosphatase domain